MSYSLHIEGSSNVYLVNHETATAIVRKLKTIMEDGGVEDVQNTLDRVLIILESSDSPHDWDVEELSKRLYNDFTEVMKEALQTGGSEDAEMQSFVESLVSLPREVMIMILAKAGYDAVTKFAQACRECREIANDNYLWYLLYIDKFGPPKNLDLLRQRFPRKLERDVAAAAPVSMDT